MKTVVLLFGLDIPAQIDRLQPDNSSTLPDKLFDLPDMRCLCSEDTTDCIVHSCIGDN